MDLFESLNADNQRRFLIYLVPGGLVLWPLAAILKYNLEIDITGDEGPIALFAGAYLLLSMAIGMILEDISTMFEKACLEKWAVKQMVEEEKATHNKQDDKKKEKAEKELKEKLKKEYFEKVWLEYLRLKDSSKDSVISRYYSSLVARFKFECNIFFAIFFMLLGHLGWAIEEGGEWHIVHTAVYIVLCVILELYLLREMISSTVLLHEKRVTLIEIYGNQ